MSDLKHRIRDAKYRLFLPKSRKHSLLLALDGGVMLLAVMASYWLRLGDSYTPNNTELIYLGLFPIIGVACLVAVGFYRQMVRFSGDELLIGLFKGITLATALWVLMVFITRFQTVPMEAVPRTLPMLFWSLSLAGIYMCRWAFKWLYWKREDNLFRKPVLLYGAGESGYSMARALKHEPGLQVVAIIDPAPERVGRVFFGKPVFPPEALGYLINKHQVADCIITVDNPSHRQVKEIILELEEHKVHPRILPPFSSIASGKNLVNLIREVDMGDLLGRNPVAPQPDLLSAPLRGKVVLVTGAGGSIGSELCAQIVNQQPAQLILLERSEPALYRINQALQAKNLCAVIPVLGSVTDKTTLRTLFKVHGIQTIYHAAAHKHVPLLESNLAEAFYNNVLGTKLLAETALEFNCERFVLISTDKAVRPTNIMGSTKRWAEIAVQLVEHKARISQAEIQKRTVFCAVRFGNVLGSSGSVIPLFKEQIASGGPVTVTHPEVNRFFMSIHEAAQLVIQASSMAIGGDVFLLDMGDSVKILDLANNMIRLAGFEPKNPETGDGDIEIVFTGLRPGEKLYEELLINEQGAKPTGHSKIMRATEPFIDQREFELLLEEITDLINREQEGTARDILLQVANGTISRQQTPGNLRVLNNPKASLNRNQ